MNPTTSANRRLRRAFLIAAALTVCATLAPLPVWAQPKPGQPVGVGPGIGPVQPGAPGKGPATTPVPLPPPPPPPAEEEPSALPIIIGVVIGVVVLGGLALLVYVALQHASGKKSKVSESADVIGGYRLERQLQTGLTSQVWEVSEISSGRHFALKMLLPEHANNPESRRLLFHEAAVGIEMAHPNVIKIIKVFKDVKQPCFVMEFFPSGSMRQRIQYKEWDFIREFAYEIFKQTATGLAYMNTRGWLHRDVKPDNILVNSVGEVRLIDFAIATRISKGWFSRRPKPAGTRSYMSPEAIRGERLDTRSDIYSFGATCYEIVTFRQPFRAATANELLNKQLFEKPTPPQVYCPDLTDDFSKLILRMLAKKREERPKTFHDVLMELRKIKIFKTKDPAPPKGGPLMLHPELAAMRRPGGKGPLPKAPDSGSPPKS